MGPRPTALRRLVPSPCAGAEACITAGEQRSVLLRPAALPRTRCQPASKDRLWVAPNGRDPRTHRVSGGQEARRRRRCPSRQSRAHGPIRRWLSGSLFANSHGQNRGTSVPDTAGVEHDPNPNIWLTCHRKARRILLTITTDLVPPASNFVPAQGIRRGFQPRPAHAFIR